MQNLATVTVWCTQEDIDEACDQLNIAGSLTAEVGEGLAAGSDDTRIPYLSLAYLALPNHGTPGWELEWAEWNLEAECRLRCGWLPDGWVRGDIGG
jgi:hypothetical protein